VLLAHIHERVRQLVPDLIPHGSRNANPAGLGERLEARRDVHSVAKDVFVFDDHVAKIDPDPKLDPLFVSQLGVAIEHPTLHFGGTLHGINNAEEFCEHAIAGVLHYPALMLPNLRIDELPKMRPQTLMRACLVRAHQPGITRYIDGKNGGEATGSRHFPLEVGGFERLYPKFVALSTAAPSSHVGGRARPGRGGAQGWVV
jgi:hypothetical protein